MTHRQLPCLYDKSGTHQSEGGDRLLRGRSLREEAVERRPFVERGGHSLREEAVR